MVRLASIFTLAMVFAFHTFTSANEHDNQPYTTRAVVVTPDRSVAEKVKVFKDPVVNQIKFRCNVSEPDAQVTVQLMETSGQTVKAFSLLQGLTRVKTTGLNPGLYRYRCLNKEGDVLAKGSFTVIH